MKTIKKTLFITIILLNFFSIAYSQSKKTIEKNAMEITKQMYLGWNLGNTLDATSNYYGQGPETQTYWQQPVTTKEMIDGLVKSGIKTLRIPISWHNHVSGENFTVNPKWMARVKEIVDWAIEDGMYVIINMHHDNYDKSGVIPQIKNCGYYYPSKLNEEASIKFVSAIWGQICETFNNNYDEHLIFETMNEPRPCGTSYEWWFSPTDTYVKPYFDALNEINQAIVDTIRKSGGNNKKRMIMIPGLAASADSALSQYFKLPEDSAKNALAVSVHMYTPYNFAMLSPGDKSFTPAHKKELSKIFENLNKKYISNGIPVIVGETGATNKDNLEARISWVEYFLSTAKSNGIFCCCLWDNGEWMINDSLPPATRYSEHFGYYNRTEQTWFFPELLEAAKKAYK